MFEPLARLSSVMVDVADRTFVRMSREAGLVRIFIRT
jgi:hypothetical protein